MLFPELCAACALVSDHGFCATCRKTFGRVVDPCPRCGMPQPVATCPAKRSGWCLDAVRAPFAYEPPLSFHLQQLKYGGRRTHGRAFGELLADGLLPARPDVDSIVAVPLHRSRLRERRFNQADEIARTLAARLHLRQLVAGIVRLKATRPQTHLPPAERRANLAGAFAVTRDLPGRRIAIVDDVVTTGATANALAAALLAAGAVRVELWTVARAVDHGRDPLRS